MRYQKIILAVAILFWFSGTALAQDYAEIIVENGGNVHGLVSLIGIAPAPLQLLITKDVEVCGLGYRKRTEVDVDEANGLRNVVVYIEEIAEGKTWDSVESGTFINQEKCFFQPHIQIIRRGAEIDIINSDSTLHNIHAYELIGRARRSLFNISQPEMGKIPQLLDPRRGNRVSLECDSHDFMQGWIFSSIHPYVTVVEESGNFEIGDIPPGPYRISVWHPRLGIQTQKITVASDATSELNFQFVIE